MSDDIKLGDLTVNQENILRLDIKCIFIDGDFGKPLLISLVRNDKLIPEDYVTKGGKPYLILRNGNEILLEKVINFFVELDKTEKIIQENKRKAAMKMTNKFGR